MTTYEYIRLQFDFGDLKALNDLASTGWRVISVKPVEVNTSYSNRQMGEWYALMERKLPERLV